MRKILIFALVFALTHSIMARNLTALIEPLAPVRWYQMNQTDAFEDGAFVADVQDESGNSADLLPTGLGTDVPVWDSNALNNRPGLFFAEESPLFETTAFNAYHFFVVAKYDGANFGAAYRGLITDEATNYILLGNTGGATFFDPTPVDVTYFKSQTEYAQNNMQAPFSDFELVEISWTAGKAMDGFQLGQDRADTGRRWNGWIVEPVAFGAILSTSERRRVNLYYDLKYKLWLSAGVAQYEMFFPSPEIVPEIKYLHYNKPVLDWSAVTIKHTYEDEGASFSDTTDTPPQTWEIEYTGLTAEEREIFDEFSEQVRKKHTFKFIEKDGTVQTGVRIENYESFHEGNKSWSNAVKVSLVKYN